jgi:predicted dienelactone hydrolase
MITLLPPAQSAATLDTIVRASTAICRFLGIYRSFFAAGLLLAHSLAQAEGWQPSPGHVQIPIWPGAVPDALPDPKPESVGPGEGREWWPRANDVSRPTMTVYAAKSQNTGLARQFAAQWHVDPHKIGVIGFSAGGHLALRMCRKT